MVRAAFLLTIATALSAGAAPKEARSHISANGRFVVHFTESDGHCSLEVVQNVDSEGTQATTTFWKLEKCLGSVDDLYFVDDAGEKVWVVYPLRPLPKKKGNRALRAVVVAVLVDRSGASLKTRKLGDFWAKKKNLEVREVGKHFKWVEGTVGLPGKPPRVTTANRLELETLEPKTVALQF